MGLAYAWMFAPAFYSVSVVKTESVGDNLTCYLQYHGLDQTKLELNVLSDFGRLSKEYSQVVNNNEIFTVHLETNSWVEINAGEFKIASVHSDGKDVYQAY